jgi:putative membrane protein
VEDETKTHSTGQLRGRVDCRFIRVADRSAVAMEAFPLGANRSDVAARAALGCTAVAVAMSLAAAPVRPTTQATAASSFVQLIGYGNLGQMEFGRLAQIRGRAASINRFGLLMATDHAKAQEKLKRIAERRRIRVPVYLDSGHRAIGARLRSLRSAAFDRAYLNMVLTEHRVMIQACREQGARGTDPELKAYATELLAMLDSHVDLAKPTETELQIHGE